MHLVDKALNACICEQCPQRMHLVNNALDDCTQRMRFVDNALSECSCLMLTCMRASTRPNLLIPLPPNKKDGFAIMITPPSEMTMATTTILRQRQAHRVQQQHTRLCCHDCLLKVKDNIDMVRGQQQSPIVDSLG